MKRRLDVNQPVVNFVFTGFVQQYVVPSNVSFVAVKACGASGGTTVGSAGAFGGCVYATFNVSFGQEYYVFVGGEGACESGQGGYNGGGNGGGNGGCGGGGASDIRINASELDSRIIVGGGGGGDSYDCCGSIDQMNNETVSPFECSVAAGAAGGAAVGGDTNSA